MAFRIRKEELTALEACDWGMELLYMVANEKNPGEQDVVFPEGWTSLHTEFLIQWKPKAALFLMTKNLIPHIYMEKQRAFAESSKPSRDR